MPSSSLVEFEVEIGVWVWVEVEVGVEVWGVGAGLTFSVGWVGGWLEIWRVKLISTQVVVEVEVGVELGKKVFDCTNKCHVALNQDSTDMRTT